jgi:hypothetical protein
MINKPYLHESEHFDSWVNNAAIHFQIPKVIVLQSYWRFHVLFYLSSNFVVKLKGRLLDSKF